MFLGIAGRLTFVLGGVLETLSWRLVPADERGRALSTPRGTRSGEFDLVETLEGMEPVVFDLVAKGKNIAVEAFLSRPTDLELLLPVWLTKDSYRLYIVSCLPQSVAHIIR